MTDPTFIPEHDRELLVVYPDREHARAAATALLDAGVPREHVHLDEEPDAVASLRAEMHDELTKAWVVPNAGVVYPAGSARGLAMVAVIGAAIGLLAAFPLALIDWGSTYWVRWLIWAVVGVGFGLAVAFVVGPAGGAPRPGELPPAARGIMLRVEEDSPELRHLLAGLEPIRMDEITHDGDPIDAVTIEKPDRGVEGAVETAKDMAANADSDDYRPER